ncbi:Putative phosphoribosyl transferase [Bremerella volcania]|uniref:Phosphoribosyl transferase n=1 Tax=Bremerella volcania TaxID=2527984 RepID=A0A518C9A1_9BACT|nr:Putative phosphoribosyl transferase [Bremerella volcania]
MAICVAAHESNVLIGPEKMPGTLCVPPGAKRLILVAQGDRRSRMGSETQNISLALQERGFATLLIDLLNECEASDPWCFFDIPLLALRLREVESWARDQPMIASLPQGCFGFGTSVAAALVAAALSGTSLGAVVSLGGRPDLAKAYLPKVTVPTLLMVGGDDECAISLNRKALNKLSCVKHLELVSDAARPLTEPSVLEHVARLTGDWFSKYLPSKDNE